MTQHRPDWMAKYQIKKLPEQHDPWAWTSARWAVYEPCGFDPVFRAHSWTECVQYVADRKPPTPWMHEEAARIRAAAKAAARQK